jgi:hypothetical protein
MRLRYVADIAPPVAGFARANEGEMVSFLPLEKIWPDARFDPSTEIRFDGQIGSYNAVAEGDVIVPKVAPTFAHGRAVVATGLTGRRALATSEVFVLRPHDPRTARLLAYRLRARDFLKQGVASWTGVAGLKRVSAEFVRNVDVNPRVWSRAEVVSDFLDGESDRIAAAIAGVDQMVASASTPALELAKAEFDRQPLGRIGYRFSVQLGKKLYEERVVHETAVPYLRNANVHWDNLKLADLKVMNFDARERQMYSLVPGDLLVCEGGEPGRSAVWEGQLGECYFQMALNRVRPYADDSTRYLMWALRVLSDRDAFAVDGPGRYTHLTAEMLRAVRVPMPASAVQHGRLAAIDASASRGRRLAEVAARIRARLVEYREALIDEAVTGRLDFTAVSEAQMDERAQAAAEGAVAADQTPARVG